MSPERRVMARCLAATAPPTVFVLFVLNRGYTAGEFAFGVGLVGAVLVGLMLLAPAVVPARALSRIPAPQQGTRS